MAIAERIAANAPESVRQSKRVIDESAGLAEDAAWELTQEAYAAVKASPDFRGGGSLVPDPATLQRDRVTSLRSGLPATALGAPASAGSTSWDVWGGALERRQVHDLAVLTWEVGNAAGGWVAAECGVAAVVIVGVEPLG
ncbi:enoyl-CoA hydratase [Amycolatopsis sp. YIM 10]|nr:enoyl-CoA hydratase [Amycolatopsis sp. YIM 10]